MKRYNGSGFTSLSTAKRFNGSSWVPITIAKRFNGSKWINLLDGETGRLTKTYPLSMSQIYWNSGGQDNQSDTANSLIHGTWTGSLSNARRSLLWFDGDFMSDLQGATIEKVELYLYREGGTHGASTGYAQIKTHNYSEKPSKWTGPDAGAADSDSPTVKRSTGAWLTLLNSVGEGLRDGTVKGIALDADNSTKISDYIRYVRKGTNAPRLRITYTR